MYQEQLPGKLVTRRITQNCEKTILIIKGVKRESTSKQRTQNDFSYKIVGPEMEIKRF